MSAAAELGRLRRLHRMTDRGVFSLVAIDHRDSLKATFADAGLPPLADDAVVELKAEILVALAPSATGVLLDAEYGAKALATGVLGVHAVVMPLEAQGYADAAAGRVTSFLPDWDAAAAAAAGADGCKLLLPFRADHAVSADAQHDVARRAVDTTHTAGLPLIVEPIVYPLAGEQPAAFAAAFPRLVLAAVEALKPLDPDVLKVQFPVDPAGDAAGWCRRIDEACGSTPWVLLGGGADPGTFRGQVEVACAAGASGYIVGRTAWDGAVTADATARAVWLRDVGAPRLDATRRLARSLARPWTDRRSPPGPYATDWYAH